MEIKRLTLVLCGVLSMLNAMAWKPLFVGHRGCNRGVENTVEAFRNGAEYYGYDGLECDIRVTADKHYVISHDENTTRLGGNLVVANATLAELQAENYTQTRSGVTYTGKICTVEEYLDICLEFNVIPVIELKWTTGINTSDMSNFPGLAQIVIDKGLADKAVFLTSMKKSLEYIRANYPDFNCQFLCSAGWRGSEGWCRQNNFIPSIQSGYFDALTVNRFRRMGLQVAMWVVDTKDSYLKHGNMGVAIMTTNSLLPKDMPELEDVDWHSIDSIPDPLPIKCDTIFAYTRNAGNLPSTFPSRNKKESIYNSAMQAAVIDGVFYANDYETNTLLAIDAHGMVTPVLKGTQGAGIAADNAGNLVMVDTKQGDSPNRLVIIPNGARDGVEVNFTLPNPGETRFISASGDVMGEAGGHVYFFCKGSYRVNILHLSQGELVETIVSDSLSAKATNAGYVYPIGDNPEEFLYQVRTEGIYYYNKGDQGEIVTGSGSVYPPGRNTSAGMAQLFIDGHRLVVHPSGANYAGGFTIRDISSDSIDVLNVTPPGIGSTSVNLSAGQFFAVDSIDATHSFLYEYCMGNGIAAYQLYVGEPLSMPVASDVNADGAVNVSDVTTLVNIILGIENAGKEADINHDRKVDISDITALVNLLLGKKD